MSKCHITPKCPQCKSPHRTKTIHGTNLAGWITSVTSSRYHCSPDSGCCTVVCILVTVIDWGLWYFSSHMGQPFGLEAEHSSRKRVIRLKQVPERIRSSCTVLKKQNVNTEQRFMLVGKQMVLLWEVFFQNFIFDYCKVLSFKLSRQKYPSFAHAMLLPQAVRCVDITSPQWHSQ